MVGRAARRVQPVGPSGLTACCAAPILQRVSSDRRRHGLEAAGTQRLLGWPALICILAAGCASRPADRAFTATRQPWTFQGAAGLEITTDHFDVYTTVDDPQLQDYLPSFLEAAYRQYASLLPPSQESGRRLQTYLFATKHQWLAFTRQTFPERYDTYSRVQVGGYAAGAKCVTFSIRPRIYTLSVIAHEGLHQYFAAHFAERIPAWLNEGLATYCEGFDVVGGKPVFQPKENSVRRNALREILAGDGLMPLKDVLASDAGSVIVDSRGRWTRAYYAQVWALTVFLRHGAKGRYADRFEALLADVASGQMSTRAQAARITSPEPAKVSFGEAVFYAYVTDDLPRFESELREFMIKLVGF